MVQIRKFSAVRPMNELADRVAALPYDVYSVEEAKRDRKKKKYSF